MVHKPCFCTSCRGEKYRHEMVERDLCAVCNAQLNVVLSIEKLKRKFTGQLVDVRPFRVSERAIQTVKQVLNSK